MDAAITLPAEPSSARAARRFVADSLRSEDSEHWELAAKLLVTELVTNAILHARTEVTVSLRVESDGLRISVRDSSRRMPSPRSYSSDATTGRGLALVERLSAEWGVEPDADGKTVWVKIGAVDWEALLDVESDGAAPAAPDPAGPKARESA
jgi:anti-sigma regulatory factor (Ser/Thr protein kinase)